jgi:hypothetical protein
MSNTTVSVTDASSLVNLISCGADAGNSSAKVRKSVPTDPSTGVDALVREDGARYVAGQGRRATYRACATNITPLATPTPMFTVQGSATKAVAITRVAVTGRATAAGSMQLTLNRRSSAGTDHASTTRTHLTLVKAESSDGTATAVVDEIQGHNQTSAGTLVGILGARRLNLPATGSAATSGEGKPEVWEFGAARGTKPLLLASDSEWVTIDGEGSALPSGARIDFEIEFEEYTAV